MFSKILALLFVATGATQVQASPIQSQVDVVLPRTDAPPPFNPSLFKDINVSRGLEYHYYAAPADSGKPTLLFLHGFPSSFYDWRHQVSFFQDKGYGLIVPDMLGYGGTAKPLDLEAYASSLISKDIVDILDAEKIDQAIVVGHDWGSKIAARLANYFPERFHAFGFLDVGYVAPIIFAAPFNDTMAVSKAFLGYENFGFFDYLARDGTDQDIVDHTESFWDIWYINDTVESITEFSPFGALEAFLKNDTRVATGDFVTPEERAFQTEFYNQNGWTAPLNWYRIITGDVDREDNKGIPQENTLLQKPVFFGSASRDYYSLSALWFEFTITSMGSNGTLTTREYNSGHWVQMQAKDEVNKDLLQWIEGL
ncbi:hypothetical protein D9758_012660 [Tetrapyrgos nigripes]|uniref:AB hydrolase-1 domain-containing protein n=1 Tax=Tetrapyrgos nigripes TaxID=182062 RepID=A0A8H5GDS2_9AGAR|nr:hypothetical protein D9758_012660 [Tetrapyrgos nigripes]